MSDDRDDAPKPPTLDELVEKLQSLQKTLPKEWKNTPSEKKPKVALRMIGRLRALGDPDSVGAALAAIAWCQKRTARPDGATALERTFLRLIVKLEVKRAVAIALAIEKVGDGAKAAKKIRKKGGFDSTAWDSAATKASAKAVKRKASASKPAKKSQGKAR